MQSNIYIAFLQGIYYNQSSGGSRYSAKAASCGRFRHLAKGNLLCFLVSHVYFFVGEGKSL